MFTGTRRHMLTGTRGHLLTDTGRYMLTGTRRHMLTGFSIPTEKIRLLTCTSLFEEDNEL